MSPSAAHAPAPCSGEQFISPSPRISNPIAAKLRTNGSVCFRVLGASMFPWIRTGDLVFVRACSLEQAARGDVILFERDARLFVHRVIRRDATGVGDGARRHGATSGSILITKGDALDATDAPVTRAEFLGRVIRVHRGNRHLDLESMGRVLLGKLLARVSPASSLWYQPLRTAKHLLFG
jgi:signal peptidase I